MTCFVLIYDAKKMQLCTKITSSFFEYPNINLVNYNFLSKSNIMQIFIMTHVTVNGNDLPNKELLIHFTI